MKKNKKKQVKVNYLDMIPVKSFFLNWHKDAQGKVVLEVEHTGIFDRIAQKFFRKPKTTQVHLDENGSFLWPLIDGEKTIEELAGLLKQEFGEAAEPLYPRIVKFFQIVESYHFISFVNKKADVGAKN